LKKSAKLRQKYKIIPNISREDLYSESKSLGLNMKKAEIRKIVTAERSQLSEQACAEREAAILSFLRPYSAKARLSPVSKPSLIEKKSV
jgi:hypothetical protein